jgi:virginiamycin B lyase
LPDIASISDAPGAARLSATGPADWVAIAGAFAWVATDDGQLTRFDLQTGAVAGTLPLNGAVCQAMGVGFQSVWVSNCDNPTIVRLNIARFLAVGPDSVWVLNDTAGTVSRIDPTTNQVAATITVSTTAIDGGDIAVGGGYVWARVSDALVAKIDPASNTVVARYGPANGSGSVGADNDAVWISVEQQRTVWRLPLK